MVTVQRENLCCICVCDSVPTRLGEDHGDLETAVDVLNASAKSVL